MDIRKFRKGFLRSFFFFVFLGGWGGDCLLADSMGVASSVILILSVGLSYLFLMFMREKREEARLVRIDRLREKQTMSSGFTERALNV